MRKLIFTEEFQYRPSANRNVTTVYKPSENPQPVNEECAELAIAHGAATEAPAPKKKDTSTK